MRRYGHGGEIYGKNIRIDFSVNTNPLGVDKRIEKAAAVAAGLSGVYPDNGCAALREKIAEHEGVSAENIVCSNGASEMIFAVVRAVMPKKAALVSPAFSEYERALKAVGCEIEYYKTREEDNFRIDSGFADFIENADMTFVCNPNNPTGTLCDRSILESAAEKDMVCVVDECFMDFTDGFSMKGRLPVIKAFTKTYAMAGLRLGYLIADCEFVERVRGQLPAWNVSAPAQAAGAAAISCGDYVEKSIEIIKQEKHFLRGALDGLGFKVFPSDANFLLIKGREGIGAELEKRGILIRECDNFRGLDARFYRIAVKTNAENRELIKELRDILG